VKSSCDCPAVFEWDLKTEQLWLLHPKNLS
jgi:hypothetical protein